MREAAAAKAAADSARTEFEGMRADAAKDAAKMMDEAKEAALRERNAMMDQARADAENIAAAARERIVREREAAERQLRDRIARLGVEVAAALLRQSVSDDGATPLLADRACGCSKRCRLRNAPAWPLTSARIRRWKFASAAPLSPTETGSAQTDRRRAGPRGCDRLHPGSRPDCGGRIALAALDRQLQLEAEPGAGSEDAFG